MQADPDERPALWTGHVRLRATDPERAANFYEKLGMRPVFVGPSLSVMELRGGTHLLFIADPEAGSGLAAPFDFMVEDLDATHESWAGMGVTVSAITTDERRIHRSFTVTDPDGNTVVVNDSHVVGTV